MLSKLSFVILHRENFPLPNELTRNKLRVSEEGDENYPKSVTPECFSRRSTSGLA